MVKFFIEIKNRGLLLIISTLSVFIVIYYYKTFLLILILISNPTLSNEILNYLIFTSITELFIIYFILNFFFTCQILYFIIFYQFLCFLASGLYLKEYNYFKFIFTTSVLLNIFSGYFFHAKLIPILSDFFLSFQKYSMKGINFYFEAKIYDYLIFYKDLNFSCFLSFQSILFLILLSNFISNNLIILKDIRKFLFIILLFLATIVTPPDIFSQIFLFITLVLGFEISVFVNIFKKVIVN